MPLSPSHQQPGSGASSPLHHLPPEEECCVCMDAPRQAVLVPCGHWACCLACTRALLVVRSGGSQPLCPLCREPAESFVARKW